MEQSVGVSTTPTALSIVR